jgi:hypothetical protein
VAAGKPASFIFATEDGAIAGWNSTVDATHAVTKVDNSASGAAIHGLAYAGTPSADAEVLAAAAKHPSANVRAEAVRAYLFNHQQDSGAARAALLRVLQPQDRKLLDVPEHNPTVTGIEFDRQLARYLQMYPDAQAPPPTRAPNKSEPQSVR